MKLSCFGAFKSCKRKHVHSPTQTEEIVASNVRLFSYKSLLSATGSFHPSNRVGGGGFGVVYKGVLRDGTQVAVKSLSAESKQGIRSKSKHVLLDWPTRAAICVGTAHGLAFLHEEAEPHIVHRDIKASNILLDKNFQPKIGDFGLAKLFPDNITHLSTQVAGTEGYLAPEYALLGQLTKKADIYSFGVLILEIVSGRSNSKAAFGEDLKVLVEWTWKLKEEGRLLDIVDPELLEYPEDEVARYIKVALFCTQAPPQLRPSMKRVLEMLSEEVDLNLKTLIQPNVYEKNTTRDAASCSQGSSSSPWRKDKQSITSTRLYSSPLSMTEMQPR